MCREGAWAELTVKVTFMGTFRSAARGKKIILLCGYHFHRVFFYAIRPETEEFSFLLSPVLCFWLKILVYSKVCFWDQTLCTFFIYRYQQRPD